MTPARPSRSAPPLRRTPARATPLGSLAAAAILAALAAAPATSRAEDACLADAQRLCSDVPPGNARVYYCLRGAWNQLSDGCRSLLDWSQRRANEVALDCQADAFAYCQGIPAGQGRLFACLAGNRSRISSECRKAMAEVDAFKQACGADRDRLCRDVPMVDGGAIACLVTARDQLSPQCQAVFWPP